MGDYAATCDPKYTARAQCGIVRAMGKRVAPESSALPASDNQLTGRLALAGRVGKVKASADAAGFQLKVIARNCMVRIIDKMSESPGASVSIWAAIENKTIPGLAEADKESHAKAWFGVRGNRISRLLVDWIALWLLKENQHCLEGQVGHGRRQEPRGLSEPCLVGDRLPP